MKVQTIPLDQVSPNALNIRRDLGDLDELADSIKSLGLLEPLVVAPAADSGYVLIAGHRRYAAAGKADLTEATCIVRDDLVGDAEQIEAMLVENLQRVDITPVEEAAAYQQLIAFPGINIQTIAKKTGRSVATIKERLAIGKLPEPVRARVHSGTITLKDAATLADWQNTDDYGRLERAVGTPTFAHEVAGAARRREVRRTIERTRKELDAAKVKVIEAPEQAWWGSKERPLSHLQNSNATKVSDDEHAKQKCHAAVINAYDGTATLICLDPSKHYPNGNQPDPRSVRSAEQEAERDKQRLADEQLQVGRTVRDTLLQEIYRGERKAPTDTLALSLGLITIDNGTIEETAELLGWSLPEWDESDDTVDEDTALEQWFLTEILKAKPELLLRYATKDIQNSGEPTRWGSWTSPGTRAYFAYMQRLGYDPTPEELAKLTPTVAAE